MTRLPAARLSAALSAVAFVGLLGPAAVAQPQERPTPTASEISGSIAAIEISIQDIDLRIEPLETETTDGDEAVIALSSDILFDFGEATLPANFPAKLKEILADIPDGTVLKVEGHTDSIGTAEFNQELSERPAKAVADTIATVRPDLSLEVVGFGLTRPVAENSKGGEDNPDGRALNRRVEIRYAD